MDEKDPLSCLTDQQRAIVDLVRKGLSNKQIGACLGLAEATVKVHLRAAMRKLGVHTRTAVTNLLPPEAPVVSAVIERTDRPAEPDLKPADLSPDDKAICALVATGARNAAIAAELGLSEARVKARIRALLAKLKINGRIRLAQWFRAQGFGRPALKDRYVVGKSAFTVSLHGVLKCGWEQVSPQEWRDRDGALVRWITGRELLKLDGGAMVYIAPDWAEGAVDAVAALRAMEDFPDLITRREMPVLPTAQQSEAA